MIVRAILADPVNNHATFPRPKGALVLFGLGDPEEVESGEDDLDAEVVVEALHGQLRLVHVDGHRAVGVLVLRRRGGRGGVGRPAISAVMKAVISGTSQSPSSIHA